MKNRRIVWLALASVAVAGLVFASLGAARPAAKQADAVTVQLKWVAQSQFAGFYAAATKGYYTKLNLDVTIKPGGPDITPEQVVASGQAEFGIDWLPSLLATRDKGGDLVNIAQVFTRSGMTEVAWKDSGITSVAKMRGKKVGVWCCGNEFELFAALAKNGINPKTKSQVTIVNQPFDMNLFLQRKIDAAAG
jgi:NitT/TauT family transport system substrate-binding protein